MSLKAKRRQNTKNRKNIDEKQSLKLNILMLFFSWKRSEEIRKRKKETKNKEPEESKTRKKRRMKERNEEERDRER